MRLQSGRTKNQQDMIVRTRGEETHKRNAYRYTP